MRNLSEILEELVACCNDLAGKSVTLELKLPTVVLTKFTDQFEPKELIVKEQSDKSAVSNYHCDGGCVYLTPQEESSNPPPESM